jgi:hypothetical protein
LWYYWLQVISEEHENKPVDFNQIPNPDKERAAVMRAVSSDQQVSKSKIAIWIDPLDATQEYTGTVEPVLMVTCL